MNNNITEEQHKRECLVCSNAITILATMCAAHHDEIVDLLTGYLWDEQEGGMVKEANKNK